MKPGINLRTLAVGLLVCVFSDAVHALKPPADKSPKTKPAPFSKGISQSMAGLRWGMSRDHVMQSFVKQIEARFEEPIKKARGAVEEDRVRNEMNDALNRLKKGVVEFKGQTTGWDVSFLKGEYQHNRGQSMIVVHDENSQNFYFFDQDKLWKWYKAFNASVFAGKGFDEFSKSVTTRFGKGLARKEASKEQHEDERKWLEWQDASTRLRAIDQTKFYGFYCLVFEDKKAAEAMSRARDSRLRDGASIDAKGLVDAVTEPPAGTGPANDINEDVADHLTGQRRAGQAGTATKK